MPYVILSIYFKSDARLIFNLTGLAQVIQITGRQIVDVKGKHHKYLMPDKAGEATSVKIYVSCVITEKRRNRNAEFEDHRELAGLSYIN